MKPERPFDQQTECIETFFDGNNPFWAGTEHEGELEGTDEETQSMISMFIQNANPEGAVLAMMLSWSEDGF